MKTPRKIKIKELLLAREIVTSEKEAEAHILAGNVLVNEQKIQKGSDLVSEDAEVRLKKTSKYVSRGAEKLAGALKDFGLDREFAGCCVLDVGASTGGFTQIALESGAKKVVALEMGNNQLAWELRKDSRIEVHERTSVKDFVPESTNFDWILVDVSFTSVARIVDALARLGTKGKTRALILVKPQFELPVQFVPEGGVVLDDALRQKAVSLATVALEKVGVKVMGAKDSRLPGTNGNQEIFILCSY